MTLCIMDTCSSQSWKKSMEPGVQRCPSSRTCAEKGQMAFCEDVRV